MVVIVGSATAVVVSFADRPHKFYAKPWELTKQEDPKKEVVVQLHGGGHVSRFVSCTCLDDLRNCATLVVVQPHAGGNVDGGDYQQVSGELAI